MNRSISPKNKTTIKLSAPRPLLDPGTYAARCTEATFDWANQWKKWMVRLILEPLNYTGRAYSGRLCKFLSLGSDPKGPYAGAGSDFRKLWVELNGAQPTAKEVTIQDFVGCAFEITVVTVATDRKNQPRPVEDQYSVVRGIHPIGGTK